MIRIWFFVSITVVALTPMASLVGCESTPHWPEATRTKLVTYRNERVGYVVLYPDVCHIQEYDGGTIFRFDGAPIMVVNYVTEREGGKRGLWPGHKPAGSVELGGKDGKKFIYSHCDGPFCMHTVSYVVPHHGKYIGVEFRMEANEPSQLQQRILDSFAFDE